MKKTALFIDRDGTLIVEPPITEQVNTLDELVFLPGVLRNLHFIREKLPNLELVIVTNQDGLGTPDYPTETFERIQNKMLEVFKGEGVVFDDIKVDPTRKEENKPTRKPGTGMLTQYMDGTYDMEHCFVIGDRITDIQLAKNLGCKGILIKDRENGEKEVADNNLQDSCALVAENWDQISEFIFAGERVGTVQRTTKETDIYVRINLDGNGKTDISSGLGFFDHMLDQIGKHSGCDLTVKVKGDLNVDEHHTIEDTAIALGEAIYQALGNKRGIERYGYCLPMDDCLCQVALDFGGRPWLVWDTKFNREYVGDMPTEMFLHFFKSLSDSAKMNLNIKAEGENEHHKIEGIFKALARAIKMAVKRDIYKYELPSTKGTL
ncbi:MAG: bifunctional histidinol-phosphatase/imidazoleglycerol-phosphate dehydratase HisB [Paludibacteraceae bacterium]|nr:bifunctional histidinol-phosphatase/imidazoleglycerol-phosphate dehydratase HisB [Paludibacteraceae bacterium]